MNTHIVPIERADNGALIVSSLTIAEGAGVQHKNVLELITKNLDDLEQFGGVAFETRPFDTAGGMQNRRVALLNEQQSTLVMTYQSNTDQVKAFKLALVKAFFEMAKRLPAQRIDLNAIDPRTLALAILEESDRADAAEAQVRELEPKAVAFEKFMVSDGSLTLGAVANMYKVGRQTLFDWLRATKVIQADRRPYQEYADWFEVKATTFERNSGASGVSHTSKLLPSGVDPLFRLLVRRGYITPDAAA